MTDTHSLPPIAGEMVIDPFSFIPHLASRVIGLGGEDASSDQTYAFHTPYVVCAPGPVTFRIRFTNLHASLGNLTVRVNAISTAPGALARTVKMTSRSLSELSETGEMEVSVEAKPHLIYAVLGLIYGVSDAYADELEIVLDRPGDGSDHAALLKETQYTSFGVDAAKDVTRLVAGAVPTITNPVSQFRTQSQLDEPSYAQWLSVMGKGSHLGHELWEEVYVAQALDRYGMLTGGARGLAFGVDAEALPAICAGKGCEIVLTDYLASDPSGPDGGALGDITAFRRPDICPDKRFDAAVSGQSAPPGSLGGALADFDFCWAIDAAGRLGSVNEALRFVMDSIQCLKVGGLAVHTLPFAAFTDEPSVPADAGLLRRVDLERFALEVVSLGHQIAQFKFDRDNDEAHGVIGLIVRKGSSSFY